jgi:hypothetical protein
MKSLLFVLVCFTVFKLYAEDEKDVLVIALQHPRDSKIQNPNGTWRVPKYGDDKAEQAEAKLSSYPHPWTVSKLLQWYAAPQKPEDRAYLARLLALSRDPRAAIALGESLESEDFDIRIAACYGLLDYFLPGTIGGGTENHMIIVKAWWVQNKEKLKNAEPRGSEKDNVYGTKGPTTISARITGEGVGKPGTYFINSGATLHDLLANDNAVWMKSSNGKFLIARNVKGKKVVVEVDYQKWDIKLIDGDDIYAPGLQIADPPSQFVQPTP